MCKEMTTIMGKDSSEVDLVRVGERQHHELVANGDSKRCVSSHLWAYVCFLSCLRGFAFCLIYPFSGFLHAHRLGRCHSSRRRLRGQSVTPIWEDPADKEIVLKFPIQEEAKVRGPVMG